MPEAGRDDVAPGRVSVGEFCVVIDGFGCLIVVGSLFCRLLFLYQCLKVHGKTHKIWCIMF